MHSTQKFGLEEAKTQLIDLISAAMRGEDVVIVKDDAAMVKLVPVPSKPRRRAGSAKGMIKMADDFDEPLEDFGEYMP